LYLPCSPPRCPDREANWTSEVQQPPEPTTLPSITSTPNRHDTESPALSYLESTIIHGSQAGSPAGSPKPHSACPATPYCNAGSKCSDSNNNKMNRRTTVYNLSSSNFTFIYKYAKAAHLFYRMTHMWSLRLGSFSFNILNIAHQQLCPKHANDLDEHDNADWVSVYHALKAAQGQLKIFANATPTT
jgi:hypothetical protein